MILTKETLTLAVNAAARAIKMRGGACISTPTLHMTCGNTALPDRNRLQALLVACAITQLRLYHTRGLAQATLPDRPSPRIVHKPASTA